MKVKICGITRIEDALSAADAGADMLGYNFFPGSRRYVSKGEARRIQRVVEKAYPDVMGVGVFVNASLQEIEDILNDCQLDLAQLSGDEPAQLLDRLGQRAFKGIRPKNRTEARQLGTKFHNPEAHPGLLVDAFHPGEYGGTGLTGDWLAAGDLAGSMEILLAGGLNPDNIQAAIAQVQPWGVDVASGVEYRPGIKDEKRIRTFIKRAKEGLTE